MQAAGAVGAASVAAVAGAVAAESAIAGKHHEYAFMGGLSPKGGSPPFVSEAQNRWLQKPVTLRS